MKDEMKSHVKRSILKDLKEAMRQDMHGSMGDKMKQKVVVASDSPEGLEEGLSKAQEILKKRLEMMGEDMDSESEDSEESSEDLSDEDLEDEEDSYDDGGVSRKAEGYDDIIPGDGIDDEQRHLPFGKNKKKKGAC